MHPARPDSNANASASYNIRKPAITVFVGLIALAIATAVVLDPTGGRSSAGVDATTASLAGPSSATTASDIATPRFQRSDEPAVEDSVNAHGG